MAIRLVIDSGSDILPAEATSMNITHIPMSVYFGDREYKDAVTLSHAEFYEKLADSSQLPTTSQITPAAYEDVFADLTANGDTVLVITISSALSGTYQSACIAADSFPGLVHVVDSLNVCVGTRILVERAKELIDRGYDIETITAMLNREKKQVRVMAVLDTLEYLKKGGRISAAVALAGNLLSIKPVVAVEDGAVVMAGKARGSKNSCNLLRTMIEKGKGIDFMRPYNVAYSGLSDTGVLTYLEDHADLWKTEVKEIIPTTVGCTIGTHVGPGAIAVGFFEKE